MGNQGEKKSKIEEEISEKMKRGRGEMWTKTIEVIGKERGREDENENENDFIFNYQNDLHPNISRR